jgi:phosphoglycolate phosphatase-like HAD superfamily hydrolase
VSRLKSLVLFDIDGTLLRGAGPHHRDALAEGIRRVTGVATTLEGVETSGMLDRDLIAGMLRAQGFSGRRIRLAMTRIVAECQTAYLENCADDLRDRICRGMTQFLNALNERDAVLGVVTGNLTQIGWKKLELAGLRAHFSVGAFAEDGGTRARLARIAANRARRERLVARGGRVSLIGDHLNDVQAAKANGFQAIAVATGLMPYAELKACGPDILVADVTELAVERVL